MLPAFDPDLVDWLMEKFGELDIDVRTNSTVQRIEKTADGYLVNVLTKGPDVHPISMRLPSTLPESPRRRAG